MSALRHAIWFDALPKRELEAGWYAGPAAWNQKAGTSRTDSPARAYRMYPRMAQMLCETLRQDGYPCHVVEMTQQRSTKY